MVFELVLLGALIFIFIISFCGLLQKIKNTYEREHIIVERIGQRRLQQAGIRRTPRDSFTEIYINPVFSADGTPTGIFPASPPAYSRHYSEPPPKYEEVVKVVHQNNEATNLNEEISENLNPNYPLTRPPPPYTINLSH